MSKETMENLEEKITNEYGEIPESGGADDDTGSFAVENGDQGDLDTDFSFPEDEESKFVARDDAETTLHGG